MPKGVYDFCCRPYPPSLVPTVKLRRVFLPLFILALYNLCRYRTPLRGMRDGIGPGLGLEDLRHFATMSRQVIVYEERASSIGVIAPKTFQCCAFLKGGRWVFADIMDVSLTLRLLIYLLADFDLIETALKVGEVRCVGVHLPLSSMTTLLLFVLVSLI